ncbi:hypothetical protein P879_07459 [Paragonimus westermani]|uniref:Uncharacterized protein n=1 Tax=Paragonimus westermani TaxID=34504 RepID=A0A8T0DJK5_9TREM|nr:hypothetical protein P879_07459 [Paragonimus westermani]
MQILNLSTPDIPLNALRCSVTSKSVDTIAWAFLRPVGANGHQNVGPRKQRLQLYEPVPDYNPLVSVTERRRINQKPLMDRSSGVESRHEWQAVGEHLYAWWATGTRVQYPSTLYVTVKRIDLEQLVKMNGSVDPFKMLCEPSLNLVTLTENETQYSAHRGPLHSRNTNDDYSSLERPGWPRESDQPCRIPNELIGGGINRFSFASEVSLMSRTASWNRAHQMDGAQSARFSPNGKWLAVGCGGPNVIIQGNDETTASQDCAVFLYKHPLTSSSTEPQLHLAGHTKTVYSMDWSPKPVCLQQEEKSAQPDPGGSRCFAWLLASASADGTVRVWWLTLDQLINTPLTQMSRDLPCDSTGEVHRQRILRITTAESDRQSPRHVTKTLALTRKTNHKGVLCTVLGHPSFVYCARFCPTALDPTGSMRGSHSCRRQLLATACYDQIVRLWNIGRKRAELLHELTGHHQSYVNTVAFNVAGDKLHSGDAKGNLIVWTYDGKSSNPAWKFHQRMSNAELEDCIINHLEVHPIQNLLLVHTRDSCPKMIDMRSGFTSTRFHGMLNHQQLLRSCITPCGSFVISGSEDCNVYVWNAITGDPVACYRQLQFSQPVTSISFHPTENVIAFASLDPESPLLLYAYNPQGVFLAHVSISFASD